VPRIASRCSTRPSAGTPSSCATWLNLTKEVLATMSDGGTAAMQAAAERPVQSLADLRQVLHEAQQMGPPA